MDLFPSIITHSTKFNLHGCGKQLTNIHIYTHFLQKKKKHNIPPLINGFSNSPMIIELSTQST